LTNIEINGIIWKVWFRKYLVEKHSNLELNGFLTTLTERWDEDAARAIVNSFHQLPLSDRRSVEYSVSKNNNLTTGHTNEAGNITIKEGGGIKYKTYLKESVARIGQYKVRRIKFKNAVVIVWTHFWTSSLGTRDQSKPPSPVFGIEYQEETLELNALIRWDFRRESLPLLDMIRIIPIILATLLRRRKVDIQCNIAHPTVIFKK